MNINPSYRPDIDGLRAIAVSAVVLHHLSAPLLPGGYIGVDVFFVISGYLITGIIRREIAQDTFTFASFYERRARRIFPALFTVMAISLMAGYVLMLPSDYAATLRGALGALFFSSNIVLWRDLTAGYFAATDAGMHPLLHTWSLAVEEQFYVLFPILLLLCHRYCQKYVLIVLIFCGVLSLIGAALLVQSKSVAVFFLSPFRAWELLAGALLAFNAVPEVKTRILRELLACSGILAIVLAFFIYDSNTPFPGLSALVPVLGAASIIHAGSSGQSLVFRFLLWRPLVYVGLISYSLYLWHWPLIVLVRYAIDTEPITPFMPMVLASSLAMGSISYHLIEQPFRRKNRVTRKLIFLLSFVFVLALSAFSLLGLERGGFSTRFKPDVVNTDKARYPEIPFNNCDNRALDSACILGSSEGNPTKLLWGDSHLLALAPALDKILSAQKTSAVFANSSACPPILGVENDVKFICHEQNLAVKKYLSANSQIKTVVMAAYWSAYFREDGPLTEMSGNPPAKGIEVAKKALASTIEWLQNRGIEVILIGPVPVYKKSVPLALALAKAKNQTYQYSSIEEQNNKHASFLEVIEEAKLRGGATFRFLYPIQWMCDEECKVMEDGVPLYRDSHHLSVSGAMALETKLAQGLIARSSTLH